MKTILRNISRMFFDDGRGDRDFSDQERRLNDALSYLQESTKGLTKAAEILSDLIKRALNPASAARVWHKLAKTDAGRPNKRGFATNPSHINHQHTQCLAAG